MTCIDVKQPVHTGSQILSPKSLEVNPCNLSHWEHGSWDLPLHTGSQVWHGCLHGNIFWRRGLRLVLRIVLSKMLDPTLKPSPTNMFAWNNEDLTLMIVNHMSMVSWGSKVGTLPPCWDLLTWVGLGTWDPTWTNPKYVVARCIHGFCPMRS